MRVRPLVSLRDAERDRSDRSPARIAGGLALALAGAALAAPAFGTSPSLDEMNRIGIGLGLGLVSVIVLCPTITRPVVAVLGAPLAATGATGRIASENARRNPRRTAATVSALTVGVALVGFITVLAASAQRSVKAQLEDVFRGDFLVAPGEGRTRLGVDPVLADRLAAVDGVIATTALTGTTGQITLPDGANLGGTIAGIDPRSYEGLFRIELTSGEIDDLDADSLLINQVVARDNGLAVGDRVDVISVETKRASFRVAGTFDERSLLAPWTTTFEGIDRLTARRSTQLVAVDVATGEERRVRPTLERVVADFPTMQVQDREQYAGDTVDDIAEILNLLYALLAVSVVIALIGITNTLSLSVHERTREIGLLRAVGMSRIQVRSMIRWEAVIVALLGTSIGLAAGLGIAFTIVTALRTQGLTDFEVPVTSMVLLVLGGAFLGILAALRPASRAARLDVISAISEE